MKTYEVVGYAYEAALHCVSCTEVHFKTDALTNTFGARVVDNEGNEISPVFAGDEPGDCGDYCDDCHEPLDNMPDDWDGELLSQFIQDNRSDMLADLKNIVSELQSILTASDAYRYKSDDDSEPTIDVRLCIDINHCREGGTWSIRTGLSDYDQRHSEYCAASCVGIDTDAKDLLDELIDQL